MEITHKVMGILTFKFKNLIEFCMAGGKKGDGNGVGMGVNQSWFMLHICVEEDGWGGVQN